jgi:rare lipoprotein A
LGLLLFAGCAMLQRPLDDVAPPAPGKSAPEQPSAKVGAAPEAKLPQTGEASWYGTQHAGKTTANGELFDPSALTAAHRTLAFGSKIKVTNLANGKTVEVRINDRGPYAANRIIDLSQAAAKSLEVNEAGTITVRLEFSGNQ